MIERNSGNCHFDSIRSDDCDYVHVSDDDASTMNFDGMKINTFSLPFVGTRLLYCSYINPLPVTSTNPETEGNIRVMMSLTINSSKMK